MALNPADIAVVSQLLDQALALEAEARQAWLAALPSEHQQHADTLREMLAQEAGLDADPRLAAMPKLPLDESVAHEGDRVGPYRLIKEIGRGGMGSVWLAERADGAYKRQVALKLPRLAWGAGLAERMAREREIGMLLEHPNIARLYDAGVDERGRPYLALEFVDGQPIDAWCEAQGLNVRERLKLFVQVIKAVGYAHGRLVVHRDLKPSNVLVTPDGQAHLLDFGIAKLLLEAAPGEPGLTQEQGRVLTPHYASPEQVAGEAITVQSDVYSLGVLLYELVTGTLPIAPLRGTLGAVEEAVLKGDAPPASSRVKDRGTARTLRGEIDAILAKAMQREPARRYASADSFAEDILRYLSGQTVSAQADGWVYRLHKWVRRNRGAVAASSMVIAALVAGGSLAWTQASRAAAQAERARLATAFVTEVFRVSSAPHADVEAARNGTSEVRSVLDQGAKLIFARFPGQPDIQAELLGTVSRIYADLGASQTAIDYAKRQLRLLDELPNDPDRRARALMVLAEVSQREELSSDAEAYATQALRLIPDGTDLRSEALVLLARSQQANGNKAGTAESVAAAERLIASLGNRPTSAKAWVIWLKGLNDKSSGKFASSTAAMREAIQIAINAEGPLSPTGIDMRISMGRFLIQTNNVAEGRKVIASAISALQTSGGAGALRAAVVSADISKWMFSMRDISYAEAKATLEASRALLASSPAPIPPIVLDKLDYELAGVRIFGGDLRDGEPDLKRVAPALLAAAQSLSTRFVIVAEMAWLAMGTGDHDLADALLAERLKLRGEMGQAAVPFAAFDWAFLALNATMKADYGRALTILQTAPTFGTVDADPIAGDAYPRILPNEMARLRLAMGDVPAAARSLPKLPAQPHPDQSSMFYERALHAEVQCRLGAASLALPILVESIESISVFTGEQDPGIARMRAVAGLCAMTAGNRASALAFAAQARAAFTAQPGVSRYYKAPLLKLELALGLKLPPV